MDCFSGGGGLGIEALSQGAEFVTFIENNKKFCNRLKYNLKKLYITKYELANKNILYILKNPFIYKHIYFKYNIVFIDPPFYKNLLFPTIDLLSRFKWIKKGSLVYIKYEKDIKKIFLPKYWSLYKEKRETKTNHQLYIIK